jgi:hypothetical protein
MGRGLLLRLLQEEGSRGVDVLVEERREVYGVLLLCRPSKELRSCLGKAVGGGRVVVGGVGVRSRVVELLTHSDSCIACRRDVRRA